ncbi:sugar transferase [Plasticicumulans acidivorans]|uniref:Sugar transferase n=1 Tax=Plasticicumulans acidivorans TaxID=886464 RepID=A0A317N0H9_9GAMM|nr:sugar transferase [Plasticicumulans acidivorans]PWV65624.1 sugar transferase [Plasticicumulans acidivorans]
MSLVGPRPVIRDELKEYGDQLEYYLEARPGITGLWQISGRSDTTYATRVNLDAWYVRNWSLWYDVVILLRTIKVVLKGDGAY